VQEIRLLLRFISTTDRANCLLDRSQKSSVMKY
jgi:hypothetical protein